ncbi:sensor histidine kinase [Kineosporia babensis]|uniref:histidine kinase n=1 Tax=Kineosporia babensis TaxID=499548 RepID=A0A9X1SWR0_9ACTN|nr:histidine kinase [Kineosporia babensis]MCD5314305.1 histidine kinase [Kineosporia babensis]
MNDERWSAVVTALRRHPLIGDAALALVVALVGLVLLLGDAGVRQDGVGLPPESFLGPSDLVGFTWALIAITSRRHYTGPVLVLSVGLVIVMFAITGEDSPALTLAMLLLMYTYADRTDRMQAWAAAGVISVVLVGSGALIGMADAAVFGIAWVLVGAALGDATRNRRAYVTEVEERARQAEQSREEEARLRVAEERMRIARELHDVVAHHIAAVKVQASGARHIMAHRPEQVGPALEQISRLSDSVLREMSSMVGLLRHSAAEGNEPSTEPTPGLDRLPELLRNFGLTGLKVQHQQTGSARELTVLTDLAAYRIIQEGLTNAQKYGDGTAHLEIAYTADALTIEITNPMRAEQRTSVGTGHGLVGMGERVASNGGTFAAGPTPEGTFVVRARLA